MTEERFSVEAGDTPYFSQVPEWLLLAELPDKPAKPYVWACYLVLWWHRGLKRDESRRWWAQKAGMSETTWDLCTAVLERVGALEIRTNVRDLGNGRREYRPSSYVPFNRPRTIGGVPLSGTPLLAEQGRVPRQAVQGVVSGGTGCTAERRIKDQTRDQTRPLASSLRSEASRREPDVIWDAVIATCRLNPTALTKTARGACNNAVGQLREVAATPEQIAAAGAEYARRYPGTTLTPSALVKHWAQLVTAAVPAAAPSIAGTVSQAASLGAALALSGEPETVLLAETAAMPESERTAARTAYRAALENR